MDELIFFGVIIFFSIVESIARSRKAKRKQAEGEVTAEPSSMDFEWAQDEPDLPTYDSDPSYDDQPSYDDEAAREIARRGRRGEGGRATTTGSSSPTGASNRRESSSETLLPGDLLAELAEMAGKFEEERQKARTIALPKQSPPLPAPEPEGYDRHSPDRSRSTEYATGARGDRSGRAVARTRTPTPPRSRTPRGPARQQHNVHLAHAEYGTDPSERSKSEQDGLDPLRQFLSEDAKAVREQLMSRSESDLRRAFILSEVLGPPVSMRDD